MATCSITDSITIENADLFVDELMKFVEAREKEGYKPRIEDKKSACITDPEEIRRICELCLANISNKHSGQY